MSILRIQKHFDMRKINEKDYHSFLSFYSMPPRYLNYEVFTERDEYGTSTEIYGNYFEKYMGDKTDINDIIADQLALYNA